jgi:hypothetical protein
VVGIGEVVGRGAARHRPHGHQLAVKEVTAPLRRRPAGWNRFIMNRVKKVKVESKD